MRLLNTNTLPNGGFPYTQPETGFKFQGMTSFNDQIAKIVEHRKANGLPGATVDEAREDLHQHTCARLGNDPTYCSDGAVIVSTQKKTGQEEGVVAGVVSSFNQARKILVEWFGEGAKPVPITLAQSRADICTGRLNGNGCPRNRKSGWSLPVAIAKVVHAQLEKKNEMNLRVEGESDLGVCEICGCHLPLKVHVPFEHIHSHTSDDQFSRFPSFCWMLKERNGL